MDDFKSWLTGKAGWAGTPQGRHDRAIGQLSCYLKDMPPAELPASFMPDHLAPVLIRRGVSVELVRALGVAFSLYLDTLLRKRKRSKGRKPGRA